MLSVAQAVNEGALPLDDWALHSSQWSAETAEAVTRQLLAIKGIGPWTVNYSLLRGYGWPDGSLHGDVAVRRAIGLLMQKKSQMRQNPTHCRRVSGSISSSPGERWWPRISGHRLAISLTEAVPGVMCIHSGLRQGDVLGQRRRARAASRRGA